MAITKTRVCPDALRKLRVYLVFSLSYMGLEYLGLVGMRDPNGISSVWPAAGLALAVLWRLPLDLWISVILGVLTGNILISSYFGSELPLSLIAGVSQVAEAALGVWVIRNFSINMQLKTTGDVLRFVLLVCLVTPLATSLLLALLAHLAALLPQIQPMHDLNPLLFWWVGDSMGILIVTPLLLQWWPWPQWRRRKLLELCALLTALTALTVALTLEILPVAPNSLLFALIPLMLVAVYRFGTRGAVIVTCTTALVLLFRHGGHDYQSIDTVVRVTFLGVTALVLLLLAASQNERRDMLYLDEATGLPNRRAFLREMAARATDHKLDEHYALIYFDLDQFKLINDLYGHAVGDEIFRELTHSLRSNLPLSWHMARLGGDECAIGGKIEEPRQGIELAESLKLQIETFRPRSVDSGLRLNASLGITFRHAGESPETLLSRADMACHLAKESGRNRTYVLHATDVEARLQLVDMHHAAQLRRALESGRFALYAQPIVPLTPHPERRPYHELLLRTLDEHGRIESPANFLNAARRYGMTKLIDFWVLEQAFAYLQGNPQRVISINLTAITLNAPDFVSRVGELRGRSGISPSQLIFEITEQAALDNLTRAASTLSRLRAQGYRFALDDFGAGVASFAYLEDLPVDVVKIDGRFVRDLGHSPNSRIIIEALLKLAQLRDIDVVAEWVEDAETKDTLKSLGVGWGQGYHLGRPHPLADIDSRSGSGKQRHDRYEDADTLNR
jgi:diguanylate cyclase (GGDEF)-like protein